MIANISTILKTLLLSQVLLQLGMTCDAKKLLHADNKDINSSSNNNEIAAVGQSNLRGSSIRRRQLLVPPCALNPDSGCPRQRQRELADDEAPHNNFEEGDNASRKHDEPFISEPFGARSLQREQIPPLDHHADETFTKTSHLPGAGLASDNRDRDYSRSLCFRVMSWINSQGWCHHCIGTDAV